MTADVIDVHPAKPDLCPFIVPFFAEFHLSDAQLKRVMAWFDVHIRHLAHRFEKGVVPIAEFPDLLELALTLVPRTLPQLSVDAYYILGMCHRRARALTAPPDNQPWPVSGLYTHMVNGVRCQTYHEMLKALEAVGLIAEGTALQKVMGRLKKSEICELLSRKGLSVRGNKDVLAASLLQSLSEPEIGTLIGSIVLYATTSHGDALLGFLSSHIPKVRVAVDQATTAAQEVILAYGKDIRVAEEAARQLRHDEMIRALVEASISGEQEQYDEKEPEVATLSREMIEEMRGLIEAAGAGSIVILKAEHPDSPSVMAILFHSDPDSLWRVSVHDVGSARAAVDQLLWSGQPKASVLGRSIHPDELTDFLLMLLQHTLDIKLGREVLIAYDVLKA